MTVTIEEARPDCADAARLILELDAELLRQPYPQQSRHAFSVEKLLREEVAFFIARYGEEPAGCAGLKLFCDEYGEVKRMFVRPAHRGKGLGRVLLDYLAERARVGGVTVLRLETGIYQTAAVALYESWGFRRRPPFGEYREDPLSIYFETQIGQLPDA